MKRRSRNRTRTVTLVAAARTSALELLKALPTNCMSCSTP